MIKRSTGYAVKVGGLTTPFRAGGGYEGYTKEHDAIVMLCAKKLKKLFPESDIEVRFNSDHFSGGAFVKVYDGEIGLGASYLHVREKRMNESEEEFRKVPTAIYITTYISVPGLIWNMNGYDWRTHEDLKSAVRFIKNKVMKPLN